MVTFVDEATGTVRIIVADQGALISFSTLSILSISTYLSRTQDRFIMFLDKIITMLVNDREN